jgi:molybdate transport system ATP-binding protein
MSVEVKAKKRLGNFVLDVEFALRDGITVLGGESGAGKTTTLRLIAGILTPDEGFINVGGKTYFDSSQNINLPIQKRRVGFVFQDYALFPHLTAFKNIAYGIGKNNGVDPSTRTNELLALFRIEHIRDQLPREMSGGEQQRVALARALAFDPAIVLLDEPLSAVDVETRAKLLDEIEAAQRRSSIPFIYVTHNPAEIERFGSQRVILNAGRCK